MKNYKILTIMTISTLIFTMTNSVEFNAESRKFCELVTASEGTTANCNQNELHLINGSFEDYVLTDYTNEDFLITNADNVGSWHTTANDNRIELWTKDAYERLVPEGDSSVISGNQIAELNATQNAALYQDFETVSGQTIKVSLKHGGRFDNEQIQVMIGEPNNYGPGDKYPTVGHENDIVITNTVDSGEWDTLSVLYEVPAGQTTTRIAFNSQNAGTNGNLLEDVTIGVDSIYDQEVEIFKIEDRDSYASDYYVVNRVKHIYGDYLGEYVIDIDLQNFKNVQNVKAYDENKQPIDPETLNYTIDDNHIYIEGTTLEEGYFTFFADSALTGPGELEISSTIYYYSQLDMDIYNAGLPVNDYYVTQDINVIDTSNYAPTIDSTKIAMAEETEVTSEQLFERLNISSSDYEDDKLGIDTKVVLIEKSVQLIDYSTPGDYTVLIVATDSKGARSLQTETVSIVDLKPELTVEKNTLDVPLNTNLTLQSLVEQTGAVATEVSEGDLTAEIKADLTTVNTTVAGDYTVDLTVSDEEGNMVSEEVTITVLPSITLDTSLSINEEQPLTDQQLISMYNVVVDGTSNPITVNQSTVNYSTPGTYLVEFSVEVGSKTYVEQVSLEVIDLVPMISVSRHSKFSPITNELTDQQLIEFFGVTATEINTNDLLPIVTVDQSQINYNVSGQYRVNLTVSDEEGNEVNASPTITILRDTSGNITIPENGLNAAPEISYVDNPTISEWYDYTDEQLISIFELEVTDADDNLKSVTIDDSEVEYHTPGIYTIIVTAEDELGLTTTAELTITVEDILPTLSASDLVTILVGETYTDEELLVLFNVIATEVSHSDLTEYVTINTEQVDFTQAGDYLVFFEVVDNEGNIAQYSSILRIATPFTEPTIDVQPELDAQTDSEIELEIEDEIESKIEDVVDSNINQRDDEEVSVDEETVYGGKLSTIPEVTETSESKEQPKSMTLSNTGNFSGIMYVSLSILITSLILKRRLATI